MVIESKLLSPQFLSKSVSPVGIFKITIPPVEIFVRLWGIILVLLGYTIWTSCFLSSPVRLRRAVLYFFLIFYIFSRTFSTFVNISSFTDLEENKRKYVTQISLRIFWRKTIKKYYVQPTRRDPLVAVQHTPMKWKYTQLNSKPL